MAPAKKAARKGAAKNASRNRSPAQRPKKPAATKPVATKPAAKKKPGAKTAAKRPAAKKAAAPQKFGRAGTAGKAEGDAPVRAYIEGLRSDQRALAERVDAIVARVVPDVRRAVKWSMPFYGREGHGWFCAFAAYKNHCAVRFFRGSDLEPALPAKDGKGMRSLDLRSADDLDEAQFAKWVEQAAALPGWGS